MDKSGGAVRPAYNKSFPKFFKRPPWGNISARGFLPRPTRLQGPFRDVVCRRRKAIGRSCGDSELHFDGIPVSQRARKWPLRAGFAAHGYISTKATRLRVRASQGPLRPFRVFKRPFLTSRGTDFHAETVTRLGGGGEQRHKTKSPFQVDIPERHVKLFTGQSTETPSTGAKR